MKKQPEELGRAIFAYEEYWKRLGVTKNHMYGSIKFDGAVEELNALGYCDYEWGHPNEGDEYLCVLYASLIWSQVIVANTEFEWGDVVAGQYSIECVDDEYPKSIFFPYQRLLEIKLSGYSQFDDFQILTDMLVHHVLFSGFEFREVKELMRLSIAQEYSSLTTSTHHAVQCHANRLVRAYDWIARLRSNEWEKEWKAELVKSEQR